MRPVDFQGQSTSLISQCYNSLLMRNAVWLDDFSMRCSLPRRLQSISFANCPSPNLMMFSNMFKIPSLPLALSALAIHEMNSRDVIMPSSQIFPLLDLNGSKFTYYLVSLICFFSLSFSSLASSYSLFNLLPSTSPPPPSIRLR